MKINPSQIAGLQTYKNQTQPTKQEEQTRKTKEDKIEISSATREMHSKFEAERQERVQDLKRQIANGEYKVDSHKVAQKMLAFWNGQ